MLEMTTANRLHLLLPALSLLLMAACSSTPTTLPPVPSLETAASTASQPEPEAELEPSGGQGAGGQGEGGAGEEGSGGGDGDGEVSSSEDGSAGTVDSEGASAASMPTTGPPTQGERASELDGDLDEWLAEFDAMLLREQKVLEQERGEASAAAASAGSEAETASAAGGAADQEEGGANRSSGGEAGSYQPEGNQGEVDEEMASRVPPDVADGSDDDIVARQLREAAMKEDDPELREKLWDEYRKYKKSGSD